jgi:hypothetical protein
VLHKFIPISEQFFHDLQRRAGLPFSGGLYFALLAGSAIVASGHFGQAMVWQLGSFKDDDG